MASSRSAGSRPPLSRERVLRAAIAVADREGLGALTMRRLGAELDVEAMSLYRHVANKEAILEGIVELVFGQVEVPGGASWREVLGRRAASARAVLAEHPWAIGLLEGRRVMGPATMRSLDATLGTLRSAGFSVEDAAHALWLLDSFVYGHVVQESSLSAVERGHAGKAEPPAGEISYPHLTELLARTRESPFSLDEEFRLGLDRILDALEPMATPRRRRSRRS